MKFNITFLPNLLLKNKESKNSVKKERVNKKGVRLVMKVME